MRLTLSPSRLLVVALLTLAAILAAVRCGQMEIERSAPEVVFHRLNAVHWDAATGTLTPVGEDPQAFFQLPSASVPLTGLVLEFTGPLPPGPSYVYTSPAHVPGVHLSDATAVTGEIEPLPRGFRLRFRLPPTNLARFDLPDALREPFVLQRVVFQTDFIGSSNPVFVLFAGTTAAAVILLAWTLFGTYVNRHLAAEAVVLAALVLAKLWLIGGLQLTIFPFAMHDDALYLTQGHAIASGDWLGSFGELTLSKGPVYPIFIALVQLTRLPFLETQAGLHALGCLAFLVAVWPLTRSAGLRLGLFTVLLLDPHTQSIQVVAQVLRSGIQPALTLLTLAGFIGLLVRARGSALVLLPWSLLAGVSFALFWFCREEGLWLLPSLAVLTAVALGLAWQAGRAGRPGRLALLLLPFALFFGAQTLLRAVNHHYYGDYITLDVKDGSYPAAYAALTRITPAEVIPGVPVTKETRLRAYAVSPAFAQLQAYFEGPLGDSWASYGWEGSTHPSARKEIRGWLQWALRGAARDAGFYRNAATANAYWRRVANEINAACDDGRLAAGPRRSGFAPRWDASLWPVFGRSLATALDVVVQFVDFNPQPTPSAGDPDLIAFYSRMLHEAPALARHAPTPPTQVSVVLFHLYAAVGGAAAILGLVASAALAFHAWRRRARLIEVTVLVALVGGTCALIVLMALVDATSFGTTHAIYLAPATPLFLAAATLAPVWAARSFNLAVPGLPHLVLGFDSLRQSRLFRWLHPATAGAIAFSLAALALGVIRWRQCTTVFRGSDVAFSMVNDLRWDPVSRLLTRTGNDPFGSLELPEHALPVRAVSLDLGGQFADVQGNFYVFQYPAHKPGFGTDGDTLTHATLTRREQDFTVDWVLQDSKVVRIDLPDYLDRPLEVRELRIRSSFAWTGNTTYRRMLYALAGAALCLLWRLISWRIKRRQSVDA